MIKYFTFIIAALVSFLNFGFSSDLLFVDNASKHNTVHNKNLLDTQNNNDSNSRRIIQKTYCIQDIDTICKQGKFFIENKVHGFVVSPDDVNKLKDPKYKELLVNKLNEIVGIGIVEKVSGYFFHYNEKKWHADSQAAFDIN